jgi:hypothetical protein
MTPSACASNAGGMVNFSGIIEPTHLRVAGSEIAIRDRETGILLDRKEQFRHRLIEPPTEKMREAHERRVPC